MLSQQTFTVVKIVHGSGSLVEQRSFIFHVVHRVQS